MNLKTLYISLSSEQLRHLLETLPLLRAKDRYAALTAREKRLIFQVLLQPPKPVQVTMPLEPLTEKEPTAVASPAEAQAHTLYLANLRRQAQTRTTCYLDSPVTVQFLTRLMAVEDAAIQAALTQLNLPLEPGYLLTVEQQIAVAHLLYCPYVCRSHDGTCVIVDVSVSVQAFIEDFIHTVNPNLKQRSECNIQAALTQLNLPLEPGYLLTVEQQIAVALFLHTPYVLTAAAKALAGS